MASLQVDVKICECPWLSGLARILVAFDPLTTSIIATWQSMEKPSRAKKLRRDRFGLIIIDECHHAASPQ